jgi:hypothetical protein
VLANLNEIRKEIKNMKVEIIKRETLAEVLDKFEEITDSESMIEIANIELDSKETIHVFLDKNNGCLGCLCEDDSTQFNEEDVETEGDVLDYIANTIRFLMEPAD